MFLKPYRLKSSERLKGSEVKRLRLRLEKEFSEFSVNLELLIPSKSSVSSMRIVTNNGFQTNVYCVDKLPKFFEIENCQLVPTLYSMWTVPSLLPYFTTHTAVLQALSNGADLMLPGVVPLGTGMNIYGRYKQGEIVAINLTSNNSAVAIGYLARSSEDLYMSGGRGVAVKILHLFGDKLWGHEPSLVQQLPINKPTQLTNDDFPALGGVTKKQSKEKEKPEHLTSVNVIDEDTASQKEELPIFTDLTLTSPTPNDSASADAKETENDSEAILKHAFLSALKNNGKKLQLPLLTSNFYRLYVMPEAEQQIDLKKSRYKKLSNFLAEMVNQGFIVVREETKGVDKITAIDMEHPELVNFITDFKQENSRLTGSGVVDDQPLFHSELTEMYVVSEETAAFFAKMNYKRGEGIPIGQIKKIVREYVNKQNLPLVAATSKNIRLDESLQGLCNCTEATLSEICSAITGKMQHSFQMCSGKDTGNNKPLIQMSLATRSGNKKVTLVSNVDCYGIILSEFIKLCKQGAAASTTIVKLPHQKREQLQIQGNQVKFIYKLLTETYKVPGKCILGLEHAKEVKKNKRK